MAKREMSDEHKAALAEGRRLGHAVREYLEALEKHKPRRGRKRTPESINSQLERISAEIAEADPTARLQLVQKRIDLEEALADLENRQDLSDLEARFIEVAKDYSKHKGISYAAWRECGVEASVLKAAGITRSM